MTVRQPHQCFSSEIHQMVSCSLLSSTSENVLKLFTHYCICNASGKPASCSCSCSACWSAGAPVRGVCLLLLSINVQWVYLMTVRSSHQVTTTNTVCQHVFTPMCVRIVCARHTAASVFRHVSSSLLHTTYSLHYDQPLSKASCCVWMFPCTVWKSTRTHWRLILDVSARYPPHSDHDQVRNIIYMSISNHQMFQ